MNITTYEASKKYNLSTGYLRYLLGKKAIKGRRATLRKKAYVWLIEESSLKGFLKKDRKPGPKKKKK